MEERRRGSETVRLEEEGGNRCLWGLLLPPPISSPTPIHVKTGGQNEMKSGTCWSGKKAKVEGREALSVGCSPELTSPFFPPFAVAYSRPRRRAGALERRKGKVFLSLPYFCGPDLPPSAKERDLNSILADKKRKAIKRHPADRVPHFFRIRRSCLDFFCASPLNCANLGNRDTGDKPTTCLSARSLERDRQVWRQGEEEEGAPQSARQKRPPKVFLWVCWLPRGGRIVEYIHRRRKL